MVSLLTFETIKGMVEIIKEAGGRVEHDKSAGTIIGFDPQDVVVFRAIEKSRGGPWVAKHFNSDCFEWTTS